MDDEANGNGEAPITVLIVDDHELVLKMVTSTLVKEGFHVWSATTGPQALNIVRKELNLQCLLQDLSMPDMSGEEVIAEITKIRPDLPVLVYSAHDEGAVAHRLAHLPIAGYLQKPFDPDELFAKLRAAIAN